jgi:hypothetical protein
MVGDILVILKVDYESFEQTQIITQASQSSYHSILQSLSSTPR